MTTNLFSIKVLSVSLIAVASFTTAPYGALADSVEPAPGGPGAPSGTVGGSSRMVGTPSRFSEGSKANVELSLSLSSEVNPSLQSFTEPWFPVK